MWQNDYIKVDRTKMTFNFNLNHESQHLQDTK